MWLIVVYFVGIGLSGLVFGVIMLMFSCFIVGMGMVGEYVCVFIYVVESWLKYLKFKVSVFLVLGFGIGNIIVVYFMLLFVEVYGWCVVFFVGLLFVFLVIYIWVRVFEFKEWEEVKFSGFGKYL